MKKIIIYQVLPRLYGNTNNTNRPNGTLADNGVGKMSAFDAHRLKELRGMGVTHIWYTGIVRHASKTDYSAYGLLATNPEYVKGQAGSPYAVCDWYDVDPDIADDVRMRMGEFSQLVERTHKAGLKVVIDFVPNHTARQYVGTYKPFTDENYYPNRICDGDWTDTAKLNYGNHDTWLKMTDILLFWAAMGVDGVRCDMAELVPVDFWEYATRKVKQQYPDFIFIGEVYNPGLYRDYATGGGFDYLYDKVGMYDMLRQVINGREPAFRITEQWQRVDDIKDRMLYFLENHDEQRIASDFFAADARKAFPALMTAVLMTKSPFMLYAGQEYGERAMDAEGFSGVDGRTSIFDYWNPATYYRKAVGQLTDEERAVCEVYSTVLRMANGEKAFQRGDFFDLMYVNRNSGTFDDSRQYAFIRKYKDETIVVCTNFSDRDVRVSINIPPHAFECLSLPQGEVSAKELFTGEERMFLFEKDSTQMTTDIPAHYAAAWKIKK